MDYNYDFPKSRFYQSLITGFFVGFFASLLCLVYNLIFRDTTGFPLSAFINVSTIIFLVNLLFPVLGIVYYGFLKIFRRADSVFVVVFILLTVFFAWRAELTTRTDVRLLNIEFRQLLTGIVVILGLSAAIFIPLLYRSEKFRQNVL